MYIRNNYAALSQEFLLINYCDGIWSNSLRIITLIPMESFWYIHSTVLQETFQMSFCKSFIVFIKKIK